MKNKIRLNLFDLLVIFMAALLLATVLVGVTYKREKVTKRTIVRVDINPGDQPQLIYDEAVSSKTVYLNSVNTPLQTVKIEKKNDPISGKIVSLKIYLEGDGFIEKDRYIFNGQRILINQKAEIHGKYFAYGSIGSVEYAN